MHFRSFALNTKGRDFVVGDLHGEYDEILKALKTVGFNNTVDRLFSVGDTVDRGTQNERALAFMAHPGIVTLLGNHEHMFLDLYADGIPGEGALHYITGRNGMRWFRDISEEKRAEYITAWRKLPVAIEIETHRGTVGIVHGEVPIGMDWPTFRAGIQSGNPDLIEKAVWGRDRINTRNTSGVAGIDRVFVGHTPVAYPIRMGNIYYIDTGLVFGKLRDDPEAGRLSVMGLADKTMVLTAPVRSEDFLDLRISSPVDAPFGRYTTVL